MFSAPQRGRGGAEPRAKGARGAEINQSPPSCFPRFPHRRPGKSLQISEFGIEGAQLRGVFPSPSPPRLNSISSREFNFLCKKESSATFRKTTLFFKNNRVFREKEEKIKPNLFKTPKFIHREAPDLEQKKPAWIYFKVSTTIRTT